MSKKLTIKKTSKNYITRYYKPKNVLVSDLTWKLGHLEDIEEELEIDLITLFKAMTRGIYYERQEIVPHPTDKKYTVLKDRIAYESLPCLVYQRILGGKNIFYFKMDENQHYIVEDIYLKDYGKTWALTRKELENGR